MALIQFYHLLSTPLERALPKLMEKASSAGLRGLVVAQDDEQLKRLDDALWSAEPASFIAHGTAEDDVPPEQQPLFLSLKEDNPNNATMLVVTNGITPKDIGSYARILDVFDGHDGQALQAARERWKAYKKTDHELQYIQQQKDGSWKKQA